LAPRENGGGRAATKKFLISYIIEQVALNKSSLLLTIQMQNTQTLQLSTMITKTESFYERD